MFYMKKKCIVMFSGGLDSRLALKIMQERGFDVIAVFFKLPFIKNIEDEIKGFAKKNKVRLKVFDCTKGNLLRDYLKIIKNPKYGQGAGLNPCIDCRIFMLKKARKFADTYKIKLIFTGEVLGQRPMSQTARAIKVIDKEIGFELTRPLIDMGISGRNRKKQIALAKKFKISYPSPAGGCLLCEKLYCEKLKKILDKKLSYKDIELLKIGRHFEASQIILGRNGAENKILEKEKGIKIIPRQAGPTALINSRPPAQKKELIEKARKLIQKYSKHKIKEFRVKL